MGNNASARNHGKISSQYLDYQSPHQWAHSFPRDPQRLPQQFKVLPEDGLGQRLKTTDNGAILTAEGTIRGHRQSFISNSSGDQEMQFNENVGINRSHSISQIHESNDIDVSMNKGRPYQERKLRHFKSNNDNMTKNVFGSEPDLRISASSNANFNDQFSGNNQGYKGRKKYKAPAPPFGGKGDRIPNDAWERNSNDDTASDTGLPNQQQRRSRLYKTRVETNKQNQYFKPTDKDESSSNQMFSPNYYNGHTNQNVKDSDSSVPGSRFAKGNRLIERAKRKDIPVMQRSVSSPEFQAELRAVTQKLRSIDRAVFELNPQLNENAGQKQSNSKTTEAKADKSKMQTMDHNNLVAKQRLINGVKENVVENRVSNVRDRKSYVSNANKRNNYSRPADSKNIVNEGSVLKPTSSANLKEETTIKPVYKNPPPVQAPTKTFYFGMNESSVKKTDNSNRLSSNNTKQTASKTHISSNSTKSNIPQKPAQKSTNNTNSDTKLTNDRMSRRHSDDNLLQESRERIKSSYNENAQLRKHSNDIILRHHSNDNLLQSDLNLNAGSNDNLRRSSSESALSSSETEFDEKDQKNNDISLQLRPTLPKKQLEIPRFSPATAWRLLTVYDANENAHFDDGSLLMEARIEKSQRQVPSIPLLMGQRSSYDKSGDSGISGDAGPPLIEDIPEPITFQSKPKEVPLIAWTPQQDLEEGSSSDDGAAIPNSKDLHEMKEAPKFCARSHVFSLSLPRESHLLPYSSNSDKVRPPQSFNSLQKLKRSIGAAMRPKLDDSSAVDVDDNWFLSSSAPNSINHASPHFRAARKPTYDEDAKDENIEREGFSSTTTSMLKTPSFTYLASGGHVMYLPTIDGKTNIKSNSAYNRSTDVSQRNEPERRHSSQMLPPHPTRTSKQERMLKSRSVMDKSFFERDPVLERRDFNIHNVSKSCENLVDNEMRQLNRTPSPELKTNINKHEELSSENKGRSRSGKKFTFQSTVRQIERRRIAEKLSKEAERKERQRLSELEAMQKVEQEFQRKRAKEKASIRQQLKLFSLDENLNKWVDAGENNLKINHRRTEPDGAVSSPAPSPTSNTTYDTNNNTKHDYDIKEDLTTPYVNKMAEKRMSSKKNTEQKPESQFFDATVGHKGDYSHNSKDDRLSGLSHSDSYFSIRDFSRHDGYNSGELVNKRFFLKETNRSSPISRLSDESRIKTPATEVLSEYRQQTREYKDFRGFARYNPDKNIETQTVIHPPVVCNMPKATQAGYFHEERSPSPSTDNYRRDFAHGAIPTSSDSELSLPNSTRHHSPKHLGSRFRAR